MMKFEDFRRQLQNCKYSQKGQRPQKLKMTPNMKIPLSPPNANKNMPKSNTAPALSHLCGILYTEILYKVDNVEIIDNLF